MKSGGALEVLLVFANLGVRCFGGPVAHLGFFRTEFVERRRWLDDAAFADLVGICQFLPGPASSQTGFASACCAPASPVASPPGPASRCLRRP